MGFLSSDGIKTQIAAIKTYTRSAILTAEFYPVGLVRAYAGSSIPDGWLLCDGSAISRAAYADLFAVIGTTYGAGNGSTTFNLPNLIDRFIQGSSTPGIGKAAGLPNITGNFNPAAEDADVTPVTTNGVFYTILSSEYGWGSGTGIDSDNALLDFDASRSSAIYGNSNTVQPPALTMKYIIRYAANLSNIVQTVPSGLYRFCAGAATERYSIDTSFIPTQLGVTKILLAQRRGYEGDPSSTAVAYCALNPEYDWPADTESPMYTYVLEVASDLLIYFEYSSTNKRLVAHSGGYQVVVGNDYPVASTTEIYVAFAPRINEGWLPST